MALGLIGAAMAGGAQGASRGLDLAGGYLVRKSLQDEAAEIQRLRDEALSQLRKGELEYADQLSKRDAKEAGAEIEKKKGEFIDDLSGTARQRTRSEMADVAESAYSSRGMVSAAQGVREGEERREERIDRRLDRARDNERADRQLSIAERTFDVNAKGADLDRQIKQITLDNAKRVDELRTEFGSAAPERKKAIEKELEILTGKDKDKFLPVPLKDETGAVTGYRIFDTREGRWVDDGAGGGAQPSAEDIEGLKKRAGNPQAVAYFESRFGKGSAARYLGEQKPSKPEPAGAQIVDPARDRELASRRNWGRLSPMADLARAAQLGNAAAKAELERRKRGDEDDEERRRRSTGELETP